MPSHSFTTRLETTIGQCRPIPMLLLAMLPTIIMSEGEEIGGQSIEADIQHVHLHIFKSMRVQYEYM